MSVNIDDRRGKWLYNYLKMLKIEANPNSFMYDLRDELIDIIKKNTNWGEQSKQSLFFTIAKKLKMENDDDNLNKIIKKYSEEGYKLKQKRETEEKNNKLDDKEIINFKPKKYFIDILESEDPQNNDIRAHYKFLLLSMLIYQPPLRTSFYTSVKFIFDKNKDDGENNFLLMNDDGKLYFIVNNDKVKNTKKYEDKQKNYIEIKNHILKNKILNSYEQNPREYVFDDPDTGEPLSQAVLLRNLRNIAKLTSLNFDMMRSMYITDHHTNNPEFNKKEQLSEAMRHSKTTAEKNYFKIIDETDETNKKIKKLEKEEENAQTDKLFIKRRSDIVYKLNKGKNSKNETIKMYNIKYNPKTKIYY